MPRRKSRGYWNDKDLCAREAVMYTTREGFMKGSKGAYNAAARNGWMDEITSDYPAPLQRMEPYTLLESIELLRKYPGRSELRKKHPGAFKFAVNNGLIPALVTVNWTDELIQAEADKYETRAEFMRGNCAAYGAATLRGIDGYCQHMRPAVRKYTVEQAEQMVKSCTTRKEFREKYPVAYRRIMSHSTQNRWLRDSYSALSPDPPVWTKATLHKIALGYKTRNDFRKGHHSAHRAALRYGYISEICDHMIDRRPGDRDAIYILCALNQHHQGGAVHKIGVTSWRLGKQRLEQAAKAYGVTMYPLLHARVHGDATEVETALLDAVGVDPQFTGFDGCTEYRALEVEDIRTAIKILEPVVPVGEELEQIIFEERIEALRVRAERLGWKRDREAVDNLCIDC